MINKHNIITMTITEPFRKMAVNFVSEIKVIDFVLNSGVVAKDC